MFDLEKFNTNTEAENSADNDTGSMNIQSNSLLGTALEAIKSAIRFNATKYVFVLIAAPIVFAFTGDFQKSKNAAGDIAEKGASEDYFGLFSVFAKETGHKSVKLNMHPFYHTRGVKKLEQKFELDFGYEIKFSKLFAYQIYNDQGWMVMKSQARGKNKEKLKLHEWKISGMSANDYCENYFEGVIPNEEMRSVFVKSLRVRKIKDELTEDSDEGKKMFRCVIDPDVIDDYIESENDRKN